MDGRCGHPLASGRRDVVVRSGARRARQARPPYSRGLARRRPDLAFLFFNDPPTPEISPLSLHAALPLCVRGVVDDPAHAGRRLERPDVPALTPDDATLHLVGG